MSSTRRYDATVFPRCLAVAVIAVLLAGCGDDTGTPTTAATSTTSPATTTTGGTTSTTAIDTTTSTTIALDLVPPAYLTVGDTGITLDDGAVIVPAPTPDQPLRLGSALDDGAGGVVYSLEEPGGGVVEWLPADQGFVRPVAEGSDLFLQDVTLLGDVPWAVVTVWDAPDPAAEPVQRLKLIHLESGETKEVARVGGIEWGAAFASYADGYFLVSEVNDGCGRLYVLDVAGNQVEFPGVPVPECRVHFEVPYGPAALAPAGTRFAYVEQTWQQPDPSSGPVLEDSRLVVGDLNRAHPLFTVELGAIQPRDLDFDGRWALITPGPDHPGLLAIDTTAPAPILGRVDAPGVWGARFLRAPVRLGG